MGDSGDLNVEKPMDKDSLPALWKVEGEKLAKNGNSYHDFACLN